MRDQRRREREEEQEGSCVAGTAITFLLIGLGAGALLGALYSPGTGKQMRKQFREKMGDCGENLSDWKDQAKDFAGDAYERGSEFADNLRKKAGPAMKRGRKRSVGLADVVSEFLSELGVV